MKHLLEIIVIVLSVACIVGCVSNSDVILLDVEMGEEINEGEMSVADLLANGKYGAAERLARVCMEGGRHPFPYAKAVVRKGLSSGLDEKYLQFEPASESDITMHRLNLCSALLLEGKKDDAHQELVKARDELEMMFDPESKALKLTHGEKEKFFKGDGYERATLYAFLALSFLEKGDFINALKCVQSGILSDSDSEKAEHRADYALLPYIGYVAANKAGANWADEAQKYDKLVKDLTGVAPSERSFPKALLVVWVGRGSDRTLGGEYDEKRYVRKGSSRGELDAVSVKINGEEWFSFANLADLNYQATTRGRRVMDHVLDRKAMAKRGLAASANILLSFGAGCFAAGTSCGNIGLATVMFSVGGLCVVLGCPTHLIGMAINAQADDRCWQTLPGHLIIVPFDIPLNKQINATLLGYRRLDNVQTKNVKLDFSRKDNNAIPVCHISLISERNKIEQTIEECLTLPTDVIAARTKEDAFADKVELTKEKDK